MGTTHGDPQWLFATRRRQTQRVLHRDARIDPLFDPQDDARVAASVTFEPGAPTVWHTHPLGQLLVVTSGCGLAQREGGKIEQIRRATLSGSRRTRNTGTARRQTTR
ncbi:cupin domain-containing protein [Halocatena pleomorpha]|uniref:hypothetical protein n=1 Tax=Halocatena pleomorpha TaxID=1785090 RepID=UPI001F463D32|nr:hypothetical protein [Halocatena pleomorpha]